MIPVIRARVASVIRSCCACSILTWLIIFAHSNGSAITSLHLMGYFPVGFTETLKALLLTAILYIGPLFEEVYVESEWRNWIYPNNIRMRSIRWIAWRNYVVVISPNVKKDILRVVLTVNGVGSNYRRNAFSLRFHPYIATLKNLLIKNHSAYSAGIWHSPFPPSL